MFEGLPLAFDPFFGISHSAGTESRDLLADWASSVQEDMPRSTRASRSGGSHSAESRTPAPAAYWDGNTIDPRLLQQRGPLYSTAESSQDATWDLRPTPSASFTDFGAGSFAAHSDPNSDESLPSYTTTSGSYDYGFGGDSGPSNNYGYCPTQNPLFASAPYSASVNGLAAPTGNYYLTVPQPDTRVSEI
ncbi:hypothetical protein B0T14DRAFT_501029 [Immersiella caudata]|uniref:Uncharacterized protein n=1 Tax=Immersiella caudata TaxID=314043 RepID=A0AA39U465_9PEZI|nr:hypothetical protein B0T14DRAFT_501029 [Immersiella caudata]